MTSNTLPASAATESIASISMAKLRTLQSICRRNNEGLALFHRGVCLSDVQARSEIFASAVACLHEAIYSSKSFLTHSETEGEGYNKHHQPMVCVSLLAFPSDYAQPPETTKSTPSSIIDPLMYSLPFELMLQQPASTTVSPIDASSDASFEVVGAKLSAILIFNLALTLHVVASTISEEATNAATHRRNELIKARDLYSMAYSIPQQEKEQDVMGDTLLPLFVKAILNNLGRCYASLYEHENSAECFELLLRSLLLFHVDGESKSGGGKTIMEGEALFRKNTQFLILRDRGFAPAA